MAESMQQVRPTESSNALAVAAAGLGGWLLLFTVLLLPHIALSGLRLIAALRGAPGAATQPGLGLAVFTFVGHGLGLALILRRHRLTPAFFTLYLPLSIAVALLTPGVAEMQAADAVRLGMANPADQARLVAGAPQRIAVAVIAGVVCLGYWLRSRRVRATFGTTGLDALLRRRSSGPRERSTAGPAT